MNLSLSRTHELFAGLVWLEYIFCFAQKEYTCFSETVKCIGKIKNDPNDQTRQQKNICSCTEIHKKSKGPLNVQ